MITEDYVSFETAKLLKEKGFDERICHWYDDEEFLHKNTGVYLCNSAELDERITAPTLQMAMKWLREVHNILLLVDYIYECTNTSYVYKIYWLGENGKPERVPIIGMSLKDNKEHIVAYRDYKLSYKDYATYEEAAEEGIKYCLENLI